MKARRRLNHDERPFGVVGGVGRVPKNKHQTRQPTDNLIWVVEAGESGYGLIRVLSSGRCELITKAADLAPIIVDRLNMHLEKEGR
jgi:hypothetical protein